MSKTKKRNDLNEPSKDSILIKGVPNPRQQEFFDSRTRFTAYGGARGGGKSWALRRKLVALCLRYEGITCLIVRRSFPELRSNHVIPFLKEYGMLFTYSESEKCLKFRNGSRIFLGFCSCDRDALRYQGQEYDIIAIDEATHLSEYRFTIFKACLRGSGKYPRRMYLTCNPGGIGHAFIKRLFIDRDYRAGEDGADYSFIPALVYDNKVLTEADPDYVRSLESLPKGMKEAWLYGKWDVFEGQFFPEFDPDYHICSPILIPNLNTRFIAFDYGFDMLAALLIGIDCDGNLYVLRECCVSGLTLSEAAKRICDLSRGSAIEFAVASPDLWNRRQDSGRSGFEIMQNTADMPPMIPADNRRIAGWRVLREYLSKNQDHPCLKISSECRELIKCLPALLYDEKNPEDASGQPHSITHAPEALRYAVMSRFFPPTRDCEDFIIPKKKKESFYD